MKNKISILIFVLFLMLSLGSFEQVLACSCYPSAPCEDYQNADVSFVGKVVEQKKVKDNIYEHTFKITETFKGVKSDKSITIFANRNEGICGYWFQMGETYLVFARKPENSSYKNGFWTGSCSGNRIIKYAGEMLSYLKQVSVNGQESGIAGYIREASYRFRSTNLIEQLKIKAQQIGRENRIFFGIANKNGEFEIKVPVGRYSVSLELPEGYIYDIWRSRDRNEIVEVEKKKCSARHFTIGNDSKINGKVFNISGSPIENLYVELITADYDKDSEQFVSDIDSTDENGNFSFEYIPPGKYYLSVNYVHSPKYSSPYPTIFYSHSTNRKNAQLLEISNGTKLNKIVLTIPTETEPKKIYGHVFDNMKNPVKNAEVFLKDVETNNYLNPSGIRTKNDGSFELEGYKGRKYKVFVKVVKENSDNKTIPTTASQFTSPFILDDETKSFKIVVPISIER